MMSHVRIVTGALVLALASWLPAAAQLAAPSGGFTRGERADDKPKPAVRRPDALPGARGTARQAAPAERSAAEMRPTEALFDAVNRGDIAAARDAIGRGAEVGAVNVLGLTPLDLAIDLGLNDLTFLLLSMRGASVAAPRQAPSRQAPAALRPLREAPASLRPAREAPVAPARQRQVAGATGTPAPAAGFLGFGGAAR